MNAENLVVNDSGKRNVVENLSAVLPDTNRAVLSQALVIEPVYLGDLSRLVIAANERDAVGIADFECEQEQERLDRVEAAVDEVA